MHSGVRENIKIRTVLLPWCSGGSISFKPHGIYGVVANNFMSECGAHKGCLLSESMLDQCFLSFFFFSAFFFYYRTFTYPAWKLDTDSLSVVLFVYLHKSKKIK